MIRVCITCPITWFQQSQWIRDHCKDWIDDTNWSLWQIGLADIFFYLRDKDATIFLMKWSNHGAMAA